LTLPAHKPAAHIRLKCTSVTRASESPILQLRLPHYGALQEVFILKVGDRQRFISVEIHPRTEDEGVFFAIGPTTRGVTRVRTHRDAVVEDKAVLLVVAKRVVAPR